MLVDRRTFVATAVGGLSVAGQLGGARGPRRAYKAVAFDAFPIFDPRPIAQLAETLLPGKGRELMEAWRARQFEYQWLRALGGRYADFLQATEESLRFAVKQMRLDLSPQAIDRLAGAYRTLSVWPDVPAAVAKLRASGLRLVFVSNMTRSVLEHGLHAAGLADAFEFVLSTDAIRTYKPDPRAYQLAVDALKVRREEILFVPFAGWDVAGAKWFGYPTFWVNRLGNPPEELGVAPDASGADLQALLEFVA